jgi:hypothetical protein
MGRSLMVSLVFLAIFLAGIVTGGFLMARWVKGNQGRWQRNHHQQDIVVPLGPMVVRQMLNELDLDRDQRRAANKILVESATVVRVLRSETDLAIERMQEDVDKILTPAQRVKLGELKDEQRARVLDQREKVHHFLEQLNHTDYGEAAPSPPASSASVQEQPPPATPSQPAPAPVDSEKLPAPMPPVPPDPVPAH